MFFTGAVLEKVRNHKTRHVIDLMIYKIITQILFYYQ